MIELEPWRARGTSPVDGIVGATAERAALAHFDPCRQQLQRELDVEPSTATLELVAKLRADTVPLVHQHNRRCYPPNGHIVKARPIR
ncbi:MAG: BTAD domain-containing putative transcriptional regulator [Caldilineaceae bacterium]